MFIINDNKILLVLLTTSLIISIVYSSSTYTPLSSTKSSLSKNHKKAKINSLVISNVNNASNASNGIMTIQWLTFVILLLITLAKYKEKEIPSPDIVNNNWIIWAILYLFILCILYAVVAGSINSGALPVWEGREDKKAPIDKEIKTKLEKARTFPIIMTVILVIIMLVLIGKLMGNDKKE